MIKAATIIILLSLMFNAQASYSFAPFSKPQGLSQVSVNKILQDQSGAIWVATQGGLNRIDGYSTMIFNKNNSGLVEDFILDIQLGAQGNIWVLGQHSLSKINQADFSITTIAQSSSKNLPDTLFEYMVVADNNQVWLETSQGLYRSIDAENFEKVTNAFNLHQYLSIDQQGLVISKGQLISLNNQKKIASKWFAQINKQMTSFDAKCFEKANQFYFICAKSGLFISKSLEQNGRYISYEQLGINETIRHVALKANNQYWMASHKGLYLVDLSDKNPLAKFFNPENSNMSTSKITDMFLDKNNTLWLGSGVSGLSYLTPKALAMPYISTYDGLVEPITSSVLKIDNQLHLMSYLGEVSTFIKDNENINKLTSIMPLNKFNQHLGFINDRVVYKNRLWVGGRYGLIAIDKNGQQQEWLFNNNKGIINTNSKQSSIKNDQEFKPPYIKQLIQLTDGRFWLFERNTGLWQKNNKQEFEEVLPNGLTKPNFLPLVKSVYQHKNTLWISTLEQKLYALNVNNLNLVEHMLVDKNQQHIKIKASSMTIDHLGHLWLAGSEGLVRYDITNNLATLISEQLPKKANYYHIFTNDQWVWSSQEDSIVGIKAQNLEYVTINKNDGLPISEFSNQGFYDQQEKIAYLPGLEGLLMLDLNSWPEKSKQNLQISYVEQLTNPEQGGWQNISFNNGIYLTPNHNEISIHFSDFNFNQLNKTDFRYQLKGYDQQWILSDKQRYARYQQIPSGNYQFVLQQKINQQWVPSSNPLLIQISTPWWQQKAMLVFYIILAVLSVLLFIRLRLNASLKKEQALKKMVFERTQTIADMHQSKQRLFLHLAHEFRTPLSLILAPALQIKSENISNKYQNNINLIVNNANRLNDMLDRLFNATQSNQLIQQRHSINARLFVDKLLAELKETALQKNQQLVLKVGNQITVFASRNELDILLRNILSNAIKYGDRYSDIFIEISSVENYTQIKMINQGPIIERERQREIFLPFNQLNQTQGNGVGLSLVQETIIALGGFIKLKSHNQKTEFSLYIPVKTVNPDINLKDDWLILEEEHEPNYEREFTDHSLTNDLPLLLIVEDNQDLGQYLKQCLQTQFNVILCLNAQSALLIAKEQVPQLILTDLNLPGLSGNDLCKAIREDSITCHIPILMLTASLCQNQRKLAFENVVNDFMEKPFNPEELKTRLMAMYQFSHAMVKQNQTKNGYQHLAKKDQQLMERLNKFLLENYQRSDLCAEQIAEHTNLSLRQLQRKLKAVCQSSPLELLKQTRLSKAKEMLANGYSVTQVAFDVGFNSQNYFSTCYKAQYHCSPNEDRAKSDA